MIPELILSGLLSLTPANRKIVDNLEARLKKEGYDISQYINDPRFQIYTFENIKNGVRYDDTIHCWYMRKKSLEECADFIKENYYYLERAHKKYGPTPEQIASQLQLETNLGKYTGERPLINSFISIYLNKPNRRDEFYRYLKDFLDLFTDTTSNVVYPKDIFEVKGSWAGAYGISQGMPTITKKHAKNVDGDGDGKLNLKKMPDAIDFLCEELEDHGFRKNPSKAIQSYNPGDPHYGSCIIKHAKAVEKIMEKRSRIPPQKVPYYFNISNLDFKISLDNNLKEMRLIAMAPTPLPQKQPFIRRILPNLRIGRR